MAQPSQDDILKVTPMAPPPPGVKSDFTNPSSRKETIQGASLALLALAGIVVALRAVTRVYVVRAVGLDDYTIVLAMICSIGLTIAIVQSTNFGSGAHAWNVSVYNYEITQKYGLMGEVFFCVAIGAIKVSLTSFYLRFVPHQGYRIVIYIAMAIAICYSTAAVFVCIFACTPVKKIWEITMKDGHCIDNARFFLAYAGINMVTDVLLLALPIPLVLRLTMPRGQRVWLLIVFLLGILVCVASAIRLVYTVRLLHTTDITWDGALFGFWSVLEVNVAILCASIPTLRRLATRYLPIALGSLKPARGGGGGGGDSDQMRHGSDQLEPANSKDKEKEGSPADRHHDDQKSAPHMAELSPWPA